MKQQTQTIDVKNLCSRKLWELVANNEVGSQELVAIASELQLRRHYLQEIASVLPASSTRH